MYRVEKHSLKDKELDNLCFLSKNLYNYANYCLRQSFIKTGKLPNEFEFTKKLAKRNQTDYRNLPAQSSQQVIKLLYKNWKSFFKAIKDYKKNPEKYLGRPKLPKYKKKDGRNIVIFTNQQCKLQGNFIKFPNKLFRNLKTKVTNLQEVRIIPGLSCYTIEVIYKKEKRIHEKLEKEKFLSIDLGLTNLATCINNVGKKPFIVNGRPLKSINQFFNKKRSTLMSFVKDKGISKKIIRLTNKRNNKIQDYLHKSSRLIINYCICNNIGKIFIGYNKNWKQNIEIGKRNNQNFVSIPFYLLIKQIQYKAEEIGIEVILTEESYTSKIDHFAKEELQKQTTYLGKRIKRGLFQSSTKKIINADVNGAIGIARKVIGADIFKYLADRGFMENPVRLTPDKCSSAHVC